MGKKVLDILLLLASGTISFIVSTSHPEFNNMEMDALLLVIISFSFTVGTLLTYLVIVIFFKNFYKEHRWVIIGILSFINVLAGVLIYFNKW
jgi:hypothetical protein